jgi:hypothetical protein
VVKHKLHHNLGLLKEKAELEVAEVNLATHQLDKVHHGLQTLMVLFTMVETVLEEEVGPEVQELQEL